MPRTPRRSKQAAPNTLKRPTKAELAAAHNSTAVPDTIAPNLAVLFVGINPGLYSGATGWHFAKPGNRFWPALHGAGFTPRLLHPSQERELLAHGVGISKLVHRATATADELAKEELIEGGREVRRIVRRFKPRVVCFLGVGAYNTAYGLKNTTIGRQPDPFEGAELWVLPNPSGLAAAYQLPDFIRLFRQVRLAAAKRPMKAKT